MLQKRNITVGASVFVRNAIKYDYCILESIQSVLDLDQVGVMDCQSDDGTTALLELFCSQYPKIKFVKDAVWECASNYARLAILANQAKSYLSTDWHFMIQADEVLHELSIPQIRLAVAGAHSEHTFLIRRIHVWGDMDHQLRHDLPTSRKPAGDAIIRLGRLGQQAHGDAEGLEAGTCNPHWIHNIVLFHYGFVRKNEVQKAYDMQTWFHGPGATVDPKIVEMKNRDGVFRPEVYFDHSELCRLTMNHPNCATQWVNERRLLFQPIP
jgi:hypothetical protein